MEALPCTGSSCTSRGCRGHQSEKRQGSHLPGKSGSISAVPCPVLGIETGVGYENAVPPLAPRRPLAGWGLHISSCTNVHLVDIKHANTGPAQHPRQNWSRHQKGYVSQGANVTKVSFTVEGARSSSPRQRRMFKSRTYRE